MIIFRYLTLLCLCILIRNVDLLIMVNQTSTNQTIQEFTDLPAQFGPELPSAGMTFMAVAGNPTDGCTGLNKSPGFRTHKYVVVIQRNNCSFEQKVRNAQNASYDAVIIYNFDSDELEHMSAKNAEDIRIPSVFVGESTGLFIRAEYNYRSGYIIIINNELPFNINTHLILPFSILIGLCFIIMIFYMIYKCVREQRRLRQHRLPKRLLKKIPTKKFTKGQPYETCVICLDEYKEGERLRILPCSHAYHATCIDRWLTKNRRVCPICKRRVFARGEARSNQRRQGSFDSLSETDTDDTAPLLNSGGSLNNHGTFDNSANVDLENQTTDDENVLLTNSSANQGQRSNPFDRASNVSHLVATEESTTSWMWNNIRRIFQRRALLSVASSAIIEERTSVRQGNTILNNSVSISIRPVSNNVLNSNLSGSFKESDDADEHRSIYEPIASEHGNEIDPTGIECSFIQPSSHGGIGVVALPNTN